jgi:cytochrome c biogenesis protein CcmG/thiol:disulfide interchange protein DsbE
MTAAMARRLPYLLPLVFFAVIAGYFLWALDPARDPSAVPSALIDKPVPKFSLPPIEGIGSPGLATSDLKRGEVTLVNVFASWCVPCRAEHPLLMRLAEDDIATVYGINYKDKPVEAREWLEMLGNPYGRIGADRSGRAAVEWGVYGVPETFVVDAEGKIRYRHIGPIHRSELEETILPLVEGLKG